MTIRLASVQDSAAIARVWIEASRRAHAGIMPAEYLGWVTEEWLVRQWEKRFTPLDLDRNGIWVAVEDEEVVGFVRAHPEDPPDEEVCELQLIYVAPRSWGTGVAQELMSRFIEFAGEQRCSAAIVWPMEQDGRARRFYEKCGFTADGTTDVMKLRGGDVPIVRYRKAIPTQDFAASI